MCYASDCWFLFSLFILYSDVFFRNQSQMTSMISSRTSKTVSLKWADATSGIKLLQVGFECLFVCAPRAPIAVGLDETFQSKAAAVGSLIKIHYSGNL